MKKSVSIEKKSLNLGGKSIGIKEYAIPKSEKIPGFLSLGKNP